MCALLSFALDVTPAGEVSGCDWDLYTVGYTFMFVSVPSSVFADVLTRDGSYFQRQMHCSLCINLFTFAGHSIATPGACCVTIGIAQSSMGPFSFLQTTLRSCLVATMLPLFMGWFYHIRACPGGGWCMGDATSTAARSSS